MFRYIENLQRQSAGMRKRVALIVAAAITLLVVVVWLSTLQSRFGAPGESTSLENTPSADSPFSILKKKFNEVPALFENSTVIEQQPTEQQPDAVPGAESNTPTTSLPSF